MTLFIASLRPKELGEREVVGSVGGQSLSLSGIWRAAGVAVRELIAVISETLGKETWLA